MFKKFMIGTLLAIVLAVSGSSVLPALAAPVTAEPIPSETAGLLFMYEEEKLARDVYSALDLLWDQPIFQTIAASEQTHMDALATLLVRYEVAVPQNEPGIFNDASLQALYTSLMSTGSLSLADALKVGAQIEEVDINDLQVRLAQTTAVDIQQVYNNLLSGSSHHLRSFVSMLARQTGETYQPQVLSADQYQTILAGTNGMRHGQGMPGTMGSGSTVTAGTCVGTGTGTGIASRARGGRR
jgi:hypothetical protein